MKNRYVEKRKDGGYWVADTRVSLDSLIYAFKDCESAEEIRSNFAVLTLEEVYGSLAYYLANEETLDKYLAESEIEFEKQAQILNDEFKKAKPELYARLKNAEVLAP